MLNRCRPSGKCLQVRPGRRLRAVAVRAGRRHTDTTRPHTGLWGIVGGRCCACLAPPLRPPTPLPPTGDHAQSDEGEGVRLHGQFVKNGHPGVVNSPSSIAVACRVSTPPGPFGQPRSGTNRKGDPKAHRCSLGIGALMRRPISPPQATAVSPRVSRCCRPKQLTASAK
jgi:hypothetical protein